LFWINWLAKEKWSSRIRNAGDNKEERSVVDKALASLHRHAPTHHARASTPEHAPTSNTQAPRKHTHTRTRAHTAGQVNGESAFDTASSERLRQRCTASTPTSLPSHQILTLQAQPKPVTV